MKISSCLRLSFLRRWWTAGPFFSSMYSIFGVPGPLPPELFCALYTLDSR